ncbi:hypothetical protein S40288_03578 [Stachybotrys chartarum IBT 40288]|nr:hypothetical protein S40288_03578 [Stachybotrys chartarum IBT 40288]
MATTSSPDSGTPRPRPRSRPCDTCRVRKTRCVREQGQSRCVLCIFHSHPCTFVQGPTRRKKAQTSSTQYVRAKEPRPPEGRTHTPDPSIGHGLASNLSWNSGQELTTSPEPPRPRILSNTLGLDLYTHAEYVGPTDYRDPALLDLYRPQPTGQLPSSPSRMFARRLDSRTTFIIHPDKSPQSEALRFAELDAIEATVSPLGRTLVDLYFRVVHPSFPILHKDVFMSKHRLSHRHFTPSLLAAVYLVALDWQLYDSSLAGYERESIPDASALEQLAHIAISHDMLSPKLSTIEAGLLLLQRNQCATGSGSQAASTTSRLLMAQLVTIAQDLGIHVDCESWSIPSWEIGLRRRLAWALYVQDRWGSFMHGRPWLLQNDDWGVQMCTAADYPELRAANAADTEPVSAIARGWEVFLQHIELSRILGEVIGTFYTATAVQKLDNMGLVASMELAKPLLLKLREWSTNLPQHLRMENNTLHELCAKGALHLAHVTIGAALHRALIRAITPATPQSLQAALRSSARNNVQDATNLLKSLRPEHTAAFWGSTASYQAAQVGSLAGLLWATAATSEEMEWCAARVEDLRWALRVRGAAAIFAREALRLLEREIGGFGIIRTCAG